MAAARRGLAAGSGRGPGVGAGCGLRASARRGPGAGAWRGPGASVGRGPGSSGRTQRGLVAVQKGRWTCMSRAMGTPSKRRQRACEARGRPERAHRAGVMGSRAGSALNIAQAARGVCVTWAWRRRGGRCSATWV